MLGVEFLVFYLLEKKENDCKFFTSQKSDSGLEIELNSTLVVLLMNFDLS